MYVFVFFLFKQKTAYEMRISDWSSDVCSSDLQGAGRRRARQADRDSVAGRRPRHAGLFRYRIALQLHRPALHRDRRPGRSAVAGRAKRDRRIVGAHPRVRSEEHTSELQSLMRISYAVFCLKKKKKKPTNKIT